jgi:hypothetical protein
MLGHEVGLDLWRCVFLYGPGCDAGAWGAMPFRCGSLSLSCKFCVYSLSRWGVAILQL